MRGAARTEAGRHPGPLARGFPALAGLARGRRAACLGWQAALNLALPAGERVVGRPQSGRPQSAPWRYRTASRAAAACDPPLRILQLCQPRFLHYLHGCSASLLSRQGLRHPGWRAGKGSGPGALGSRVSGLGSAHPRSSARDPAAVLSGPHIQAAAVPTAARDTAP